MNDIIQTGVTITVSVLCVLFILIAICCCIFKQQRRVADVIDEDENPTYGDYLHPNPRVEVVDSNTYYSSDYEAGTGTSRTTDNNPLYE